MPDSVSWVSKCKLRLLCLVLLLLKEVYSLNSSLFWKALQFRVLVDKSHLRTYFSEIQVHLRIFLLTMLEGAAWFHDIGCADLLGFELNITTASIYAKGIGIVWKKQFSPLIVSAHWLLGLGSWEYKLALAWVQVWGFNITSREVGGRGDQRCQYLIVRFLYLYGCHFEFSNCFFVCW